MRSNQITNHLQDILRDKKNVLALSAILLSVVTATTQFTLVGIVLQIVLLGFYFPIPAIISGVASRIALGFLLSIGSWSVTALGFWAVNAPITPSLVIIIQAVVLIGLVVSAAGSRSVSRIRIDRPDIIVMLISLLSGGIIFWGALGGGPVGQQALRYATTGFDNTIHLSILLSDYQQRGYVYGPKDKVIDTMLYPDFVSYPQGWHVGASVLLQSTTSFFSSLSPTKLLVFYISLQILWYMLLVFIFHITVLTVLRLIAKRMTWQMLVGVVGLGTVVQAGVFIGLLQSGFTNFIALLVYTLLLILVTVSFTHEAALRKSTENLSQIHVYLSLSLFIGAILSLVWTLAAPIGYLCTGVLLAYFMQDKKNTDSLLGSLMKRPWLLALNVFLALIPILQVYFQVAYGLKPNQLNETGGIQELNYLVLLICLVVCFGWYIREKSDGLREAFIGSFAGAALLSGGIYFYQYYTAGVVNYYSIKLGFIMLTVLLAFTLPVVVFFLSKHLRSTSPLIYVIGLVCLCIALPQTLSLNLSHVAFATDKSRLLSPYSASQIVNEYPAIVAGDAVVVVFKQLSYEEDLITTNFIRNVTRNSSQCQTHQVADLLLRRVEALYDEIATCSKNEPTKKTIVIASSLNYESLTQRFSTLPNVEVLLSN